MQKQKNIPANEIQIQKEMKLAVDAIIPYNKFLNNFSYTKQFIYYDFSIFNILGYTPIT